MEVEKRVGEVYIRPSSTFLSCNVVLVTAIFAIIVVLFVLCYHTIVGDTVWWVAAAVVGFSRMKHIVFLINAHIQRAFCSPDKTLVWYGTTIPTSE